MIPAAIYARYSSHAQNDESIEQQLDECEAYASAHGLQIVATYADRAMTGRNDRRPEFQRMIRAAEAHEFSVVVAYKSNRIARNMLQALQYEARLDRAGVRVVYAREEFGDTATGRFMLRSMMNLNQFYSENMAEDITRGMMDNARQCRVNGSLPLGYQRGPDGKYQIDESTAPVVREIFTRLAAGEPQAQIADDLNRRHIPTATGGKWNKGSFHRMTANERYIGVYQFRDIRIEGGIPAILTRELFDAARDRLHRTTAAIKARRREPDRLYALTGKIYCAGCGSPMRGTCGTGKAGGKYYYYRCRGCGEASIRQEVAEDLVVDALRAVVMDDATLDQLVAAVMELKGELTDRSDLDALTSRLKETRTAKANIMRAIETGVSSRTLAYRLAELERAEDELGALIAAEKRKIPDVTPEMVRFYFEQFRKGEVDDPAYRRLLIDTFLRAVYVYPDHLDITFSFEDGDDRPPARVELEDGVCIGYPGGHHTMLIQTLTRVGRVFVMSVNRKAPA